MKYPKHLNLFEFRVSEIGKGYLIRRTPLRIIDPHLDRNISIEGCKVVLCLNPAQKSVYATDCTAILLYSDGTLMGFRLGNKDWGYVCQSLVLRFRDVLWFKGMVYAVDDGGRLYVIDHITLHVTETVVDHRIFDGPHSFRLVESSNEVYLFVDVRKVYKLNQMQHKWDEGKSLGGKAVFLGFDCCFMVSTQNILSHGGDFVLFNESILKDSYINKSEFKEVAKGLGIYIYCFAASDGTNSQPDLFYQALCNLLWPPSSWFWQDKMLQVYSREPIESDEMLPATSNQEGAPLQKHTHKSSAPLSGPKSRKKTAEIASTSAAQDRTTGNSSNSEAREETTRILSTTEDVKHVIEQAFHLEASRVECSNTQITHSVLRAYITSMSQSNQSDNSTVKFEGLEIRSNLLPTLQKVWSKHGNLIENITIRNGDIVSRALESLASAVLILEENPVRTLTDSQADYLSSTLSDLRSMQFKVDWLVPFVEKAVELHKSKLLMDSLDKLGHCKAQVAQKKSKLLEEVAALDKLADELEEEIAGVSKVVSLYGNVDLGKPLGGGLS
ncbi:uncharacterized protein LOC110727541 [Chenopodium quinoa]|uniref:uncharacterized protein LOC110727541 n=1 Tax=Chenopodium quinoa TaxID=63459 RepID=UPI000B776953|nr:uncharacterized protein LOC110727541 [Chenopodium quinoa]